MHPPSSALLGRTDGIISSSLLHPRVHPGATLGPYTLVELVRDDVRAHLWSARHRDGTPHTLRVRTGPMAGRAVPDLVKLRGPGLAPVFDIGQVDDVVWQSTEAVPGHTLLDDTSRSVVARVDRVLMVGATLCRALAELHGASLVHGALAPDRVRIDREGAVWLVDVGAGEPVGPYTAPETVGGVPHDARIDVFAAGALLHEMVAGRREPPAHPTCWHDVQCLERLPDLGILFREVPRGLAWLIQQMTAIDPRDRPTAAACASRLEQLREGATCAEWPEPPFVDPGSWWHPLRSCVAAQSGPAVWVLQGATGTGRRRFAERLQRESLLRGRWTLHGRCRADRIGAPLTQILEALLDFLPWPELREVMGDDGGTIRQFWPHLPVPGPADPDHPHATQAAEALVSVLARLAERQPLLVVLHHLEQADSMTLRALPHLARRAGPSLGLLVLHENRWATRPSAAAVALLRERMDAGVMETKLWSPPRATTLAAALCPEAPPTFTQPLSPYMVIEASLHVLAAWRGEAFEPPPGHVWPLLPLAEPVPTLVVQACVGAGVEPSPWIVEERDTMALSGATARRLALPRLTDLRRTATSLASAWDRVQHEVWSGVGPLASAWILADKPVLAWHPAVLAAITAAHHDRFREARRWLQVLDTLDQPTARDQDLEFALAHARARTALFLDRSASPRLMEQAERRARTDEHRSWARLLRAERAWRQGDVRAALVKALRAGSPSSGAPPEVQIHALLVALRSRIRLGEPTGIERDLMRAQALYDEAPTESPTRLGLVRAELAYLRDDLLWCRAVSEETLRDATQRHDALGIAAASHRLASVWRRLGRRADAELHARTSLDAARATGDPFLVADAKLLLSLLWAERGRWLAADALLAKVRRNIEVFDLRMLAPSAVRLSLQLAALTGDQSRAEAALRTLDAAPWGPAADDEWPAALVGWHRVHGDLRRALEVESPGSLTAYGAAVLHLARAQAGLDAGDAGLTAVEATRAVDLAARHGFDDVAVQAGLVRGLVHPIDDDAWSALLRRAAQSPGVACSIGALALDARKHRGSEAANRWLHLLAQSRRRGYLPGIQEARAWLGSTPTTP